MDGTHPLRWPTAAVAVVAAALAGSLLGREADAATPRAAEPQIEPTRQALRTLDAAEAQALLDLYAAESALSRARSRAVAAGERAAEAREQVAATRRSLAAMQASQEAVRGQLADRLRFLYRSGDVDTVAVLLTATSLDDALGRLDALRRLTQEDTRLITDMQAAEAEVARTLGRLRTAEATLATEAERARAERRRLSAAVGDRRSVVADLAARRRLTAARLVALQAAAREADRRAAEVARRREQARAAAPVAAEPDPPAEDPGAAAPSPPPSTPEPAEAGGTFEVEATAYTLRGATATGVPTQRGVCAVDPAVIPLGTRFEVSGYGSCVAADTGGAIVGRRIDVWVATNAEASAWGRRVVTVTLG